MAVEEDPPPAVPEWVVSFGDMMSLLLTFFIMLVSMSEVKKEDDKFQALTEALRHRFGDDVWKLDLGEGSGQPAATRPMKHSSKALVKWDNSTNQGAKVNAPAGAHSRVRGLRPGTQIMVGGALVFDGNSTTLTPESRQQLAGMIEELRGKPQRIEIRGHTSKRPLPDGGPLRDHWDLAYARCREVMQALVAAGVDARRIRMGVAGDNEPVHFRGDPLMLKENSRVEVFMLNEVPETLLTR